jgi:hypothetical protein
MEAHMTVNKNEKETAHQLWCDRIQNDLEKILWPKAIRNGRTSFMASRDSFRVRADEAKTAAVNFENLRLRIHVDEMILKLNAANKAHEEAKALKPSWYQVKKLRARRIRIAETKATLEAYQAAVLILVNTKPPSKVVNDGK